MGYIFKTTERNNAKASEYETKALLYLYSLNKDSNLIQNFIIDCFNDISACDANYSKIWDIQSKGVKNLTPKTIGRALYTLFGNFLHEFPFEFFILLIPRIDSKFFKDASLRTFGLNNFNLEWQEKVINGLCEEYKEKTKNTPNIDDVNKFLKKIIFVFGDKEKADYIKEAINFKTPSIHDSYFIDIFREISNSQTAYKNISVHNQEINSLQDIEKTKKVMKKADISALIVNRFLSVDVFKSYKNASIDFLNLISRSYSEEERIDILQEANEEFAKLLFDKNNKNNFWKFFEYILTIVINNIKEPITTIFNKLNRLHIHTLVEVNDYTILYLISLIKDGFENENKNSSNR